MMQIVFSIDLVNIKVIDNFIIFLLLKFYEFRLIGLGDIDFTI